MHIIMESSDFTLRNAGDNAMQDICATRVADLWPAASICLVSDAPHLVPRRRPNIVPMSSAERTAWLRDRRRTPRFPGLPLALARFLDRTVTSGSGASSPLDNRLGLRALQDADGPEARRYQDRVATASLLVVPGMGGITDAFPEYAHELLTIIALAIRCRVPVALMGQGIGPLRDAALRQQAWAILPHVRLIALRERRTGEPLMRSLGVSRRRLITTGDDAIELAFERRCAAPGDGIGVNLRRADYSTIGDDDIATCRRVLHEFATARAARLVPVPISNVAGEEDAMTIQLLTGRDGSASVPGGVAPELEALFEQVNQCRLVVTGSYHAAVFALAAGIPAVGIARSEYYRMKFLGLAEQFPVGCKIVVCDGALEAARLWATIDVAWDTAPAARAALLRAAQQQVTRSRHAYERLVQLARDSPAENT